MDLTPTLAAKSNQINADEQLEQAAQSGMAQLEEAWKAWGLQDMHGNVWEWCLDPITGQRRRLPQLLPRVADDDRAGPS